MLCLVDPRDIDHPVAIKRFGMGMHRPESYSALETERLRTSAKELLNVVLTPPLLAKSGRIFLSCCMLVHRGASLRTAAYR